MSAETWAFIAPAVAGTVAVHVASAVVLLLVLSESACGQER